MVLRLLARAAGRLPKVGVRRLGKSSDAACQKPAQRRAHRGRPLSACAGARAALRLCGVSREHACMDQAKGTGRRCFGDFTVVLAFHSHSYWLDDHRYAAFSLVAASFFALNSFSSKPLERSTPSHRCEVAQLRLSNIYAPRGAIILD